ncbi:NAD-P-binding protein [Irpex rosettiformis]|uniref:NAD-P-binding protein n=1 Tax=Irpex rosettiformis TaxID=378272 RepID=A0ACB8U9N3_9APHY|nr:NAD-P-binding protein [Irpex rosettiformis]
MSKTPIFLIGATGYIGGTVLARLLAHPSKDTFDITVLVRSEEKAKKLETFGVKTVIGSYTDTALVEQLAEKAHVVFSCADADALDAANAFLAGLRKRHAKLGDLPILIHTSGTGLLTFGDSAKGEQPTDKIYFDNDPDDIEKSFPPTALHRNVDLAIVQADKEGYVRAYIVLPSTIWGIAKNPLVDAGIQNPHSQQIPALINAALARGQAGVVGKGRAYWPSVNIEEQGDLFIILYDAVVSNPEKIGHGRDGFYFGENGEHLWYDISKAIGKVLVKRGISKSDEPTSFTTEELVKYFISEEIGGSFGTNSRARGIHSRSIGWQPKLGTRDMLDSIDTEVEAILKLQQKA